MKALTFLGFAALFMRLGSLITNTIEHEVDDLGGNPQLIASTQSHTSQQSAFTLPKVFIMFPPQQPVCMCEEHES